MLWDELRNFTLFGDDFVYVAEARDWPTAAAHLWKPHNTHVVPLFRLWTFALVTLAGRLAYLPAVLAGAAYFGLVAAMLTVGHFVARETGRTALGLAAMAALGVSTVTHPAVTWYSAGQALWAGTAVVATVAAARSWSAHGGLARFTALALGLIVAPAIWSGGLVAGPAAIAYLVVKKRAGVRGPALLLAIVTLVAGMIVLALSWRHLGVHGLMSDWHGGRWRRPIHVLAHSVQALVEACGFGNLGIDAVTTPWQAVALLFAAIVLHAWSRGGPGRINPLEAAGATVAAGSYLLAYALRGHLPYGSLRALGWYHVIPQLGVILFAAGWWSAIHVAGSGQMNLRQAASVVLLIFVFCMIQVPRRDQQRLLAAPPFTASEASSFPTPELRLMRAHFYKAESHRLQVRALARLDRVDGILSQASASPEILRDFMGRVLIPGIPESQIGSDAFDLLAPRRRNAKALVALSSHRSELIELLRPEAPLVPFWLDRDHPLARTVRDISAVRDENRLPP
jgi:hypothetical protein